MAISMSQKEVKIGKTGCFHKMYLHRYFFLQMKYIASQNITYKQYRKKKMQNNTVPTSIKACWHSLSARLKVNEKKGK